MSLSPSPVASPTGPSLEHHETFVIVAETLAGWRSPSTPEGQAVLARHYQWAAQHRASGALLLAGPVDVASLAPGAPTPVGQMSGLLVFKAASRQAAEAIAHADPFHQEGCRRNAVHAWSIRFAQPGIASALAEALANRQEGGEAPLAPEGSATS